MCVSPEEGLNVLRPRAGVLLSKDRNISREGHGRLLVKVAQDRTLKNVRRNSHPPSMFKTGSQSRTKTVFKNKMAWGDVGFMIDLNVSL